MDQTTETFHDAHGGEDADFDEVFYEVEEIYVDEIDDDDKTTTTTSRDTGIEDCGDDEIYQEVISDSIVSSKDSSQRIAIDWLIF